MKTRSLGLMLVALTACASAGAQQQGTPSPTELDATAASSPSGEFRAAEEGGEINNSTTAFPSKYTPLPSTPVLIRNATVMTATDQGTIQGASVLLRDGKIVAVGADVQASADVTVVDGAGKFVTPGIIDTHSHVGVYAAPGDEALSDGNEATDPNTAQVWAEHSVWPQDPQIPLTLAGGVTTMLILPGSANLFGGRGVVVRNLPFRTVQEMKFPGAPYALKMACGENPKRVYGGRGRYPSTRMGEMAAFRQAWIDAAEYKKKWDDWREDGAKPESMPHRDLRMETLMSVLNGETRVQNHCYRADEMAQMIAMSHEFGYKIAGFHHAVEAYKIRDLLKQEGICANMWSDWWGFKMEAMDGIEQNIALLAEEGTCAILHTDSPDGAQRMNQDAAKALAAGLRAGIELTKDDALRWITINPAKDLGIEGQTGSLEAGKRADVVVWSGDPFSVYSRAEKVYIDGALAYDRGNPSAQPVTDFQVGQTPTTGGAR